jgi:hypothetical protein
MSYAIKNGKLRKRKWKAGDTVFISFGCDLHGHYWWAETAAELDGNIDITQFRHGGPFSTQAEAAKDAQIQTLGPQCKIEEGGMWDPAWDRPQ